MNTLFDEHNNMVVEYAHEARIPYAVFDQMIIHHESLLMENLEGIASVVGGSVISSLVKPNGSVDHSQFEVIGKEEHA